MNLSLKSKMDIEPSTPSKIQTPALIAAVVALHVVAVGAIVLVQGCAATRRSQVEPPPAPVLPTEPAPRVEPAPVTPRPSPTVDRPRPVTPEPTPAPAAPRSYTVRSGDNLSTIARRHGVSVEAIMELNEITNPDRIQVDQELLLPATATPARPAPATQRPVPTQPAVEGATYTVRAGDVLSSIAARHGVTTAALIEANNITNPDRIIEGQKLVIPGVQTIREPEPRSAPRTNPVPARGEVDVRQPMPVPAAPSSPAPTPEPQAGLIGDAEPFVYEVRPGDTISQLARDYSVLESQIVELNNLTPGQRLQPGQQIKIPGLDL